MKNCDKCACINEQTSRLPTDRTRHSQRAVSLPPQRDSREFFRRRDGTEVHLPCLIHFKENKFRPAIDHGFMPSEKIQTQDAINASVPSVGMA